MIKDYIWFLQMVVIVTPLDCNTYKLLMAILYSKNVQFLDLANHLAFWVVKNTHNHRILTDVWGAPKKFENKAILSLGLVSEMLVK
jgi:hypothetical protein